MFIRPLITLLLPTLLLAAPLAPRADDCVPTIYTINEYTFTTGANSTNPAVHFYFIPTYTNPSIITDPSLITTGGSSCGANAATLDTFPTESECSTGRANLIWDLRNRVDRAEIQIIHGWGCNAQSWISSTPVKIDPINCNTAADGSVTCSSASQQVTPQNVRRICSTPTCPE